MRVGWYLTLGSNAARSREDFAQGGTGSRVRDPSFIQPSLSIGNNPRSLLRCLFIAGLPVQIQGFQPLRKLRRQRCRMFPVIQHCFHVIELPPAIKAAKQMFFRSPPLFTRQFAFCQQPNQNGVQALRGPEYVNLLKRVPDHTFKCIHIVILKTDFKAVFFPSANDRHEGDNRGAHADAVGRSEALFLKYVSLTTLPVMLVCPQFLEILIELPDRFSRPGGFDLCLEIRKLALNLLEAVRGVRKKLLLLIIREPPIFGGRFLLLGDPLHRVFVVSSHSRTARPKPCCMSASSRFKGTDAPLILSLFAL